MIQQTPLRNIYCQPSIFMDVKPMSMEDRMYHVILSKGLEYPWIWVSAGASGTNPIDTKG